MTPYRIAIMNAKILENLCTIAWNKEQKKTKIMKTTSLRTFKVKFLTCILQKRSSISCEVHVYAMMF